MVDSKPDVILVEKSRTVKFDDVGREFNISVESKNILTFCRLLQWNLQPHVT